MLLAHYDLRVFGCISFQIANHLVQRGVPPGAVDSQGATPLHYAACNHNLAFCRFLWGKNFNNNFFSSSSRLSLLKYDDDDMMMCFCCRTFSIFSGRDRQRRRHAVCCSVLQHRERNNHAGGVSYSQKYPKSAFKIAKYYTELK